MPTQKTQREERESKSEREHVRETPPLWLLFLYFFSSPPGPGLCKLGQPEVLFVLPEVLTLAFGPSFVLFLWAFPFLVFQPLPFWTPFSYSNYLTFPLQKMGGPILWEQECGALSGYFPLNWDSGDHWASPSCQSQVSESLQPCPSEVFRGPLQFYLSLLNWHCMLQLVDLCRDKTGQTIDSTRNNHKHHQYSITRISRGISQF